MTGSEIMNIALDLCGLKSTSGTNVTDTADLQSRTLALLNTLLAENSILDCRIRKTEHELLQITALNNELGCSDIVAKSVLPYGLASLYMLGEDDILASNLNKLYNDARKTALTFGKAKILPITEVYE